MSVTDQAFLVHCSAINCLTIQQLVSITAFCVRIYTAGRGLSILNLSCNLFVITLVEGNNIGIIRAFSVAVFLLAVLSVLHKYGATR